MIYYLIGKLLSLNAYINILYCKNLQDYNIINLKYKLNIMNNTTSTRSRLEVTFKHWSLAGPAQEVLAPWAKPCFGALTPSPLPHLV